LVTMNSKRCIALASSTSLLLAAGLMIWGDAPFAVFMRRFDDTLVSDFFASITDLATAWIWYPLALAGICFAFIRQKLGRIDSARWIAERRAWIFMIAAMASSSAVKNFLKLAFGRERPNATSADGIANFYPFDQTLQHAGFPSGHSQSICAAMLALAFIYPPLRPLYAVIAAMVVSSRVVIGMHYVSDVLVGGLIGIVAVLMWRTWFERSGISVRLAPVA